MKLILLSATAVLASGLTNVDKEAFCADACSCNCNGGNGLLDKLMDYVDCSLPNMMALMGMVTQPQAAQLSQACTIATEQ